MIHLDVEGQRRFCLRSEQREIAGRTSDTSYPEKVNNSYAFIDAKGFASHTFIHEVGHLFGLEHRDDDFVAIPELAAGTLIMPKGRTISYQGRELKLKRIPVWSDREYTYEGYSVAPARGDADVDVLRRNIGAVANYYERWSIRRTEVEARDAVDGRAPDGRRSPGGLDRCTRISELRSRLQRSNTDIWRYRTHGEAIAFRARMRRLHADRSSSWMIVPFLPALFAVVACSANATEAETQSASVTLTCGAPVFTGNAKLDSACEQCVQASCCAEVTAFKQTPPQPLDSTFVTPNNHAECVANCLNDESVDPIHGPMVYCDPLAGPAIVAAYNAIYACAETHCLPKCSEFVVIPGERP
jgi:hypothetical protein